MLKFARQSCFLAVATLSEIKRGLSVPLPQQAQAEDTIAPSATSASASSTATTSLATSSSTGISNAELVGYAAAGLGGLLFLTMGGIFYRKYRKRKLKAEGTETSSNIEGKVTSHANAEVVASSSKADNDSTSESESELDVPNMAGRGVSRAKRPTLKTDPASLRRKVSPSASPSTNGSEDDGTPQTERVKTLKHKRKAKKNIKQPVSDPESDYSSTDSSDSTDDSDARLRRKTRQT